MTPYLRVHAALALLLALTVSLFWGPLIALPFVATTRRAVAWRVALVLELWLTLALAADTRLGNDVPLAGLVLLPALVVVSVAGLVNLARTREASEVATPVM